MPKPELTIRPLLPSDLDAISGIHARACRIAYAFMGWDYALGEVRDWYASKLDGWDWGRVAEWGGAATGFVAMEGGHLDQLFVDPGAQRRGIGSALLGEALGRGLRPVTLNVFELNAPARRLYERRGFGEAGRWWNEQDGAVELLYRLKQERGRGRG